MGQLRADILAVRLQPDAELPLKILSYRYDVGLTPLREALTLLSGVGLVVHDRRGFRVAPVSRAEFAGCRGMPPAAGRHGARARHPQRHTPNGGGAWARPATPSPPSMHASAPTSRSTRSGRSGIAASISR